MRTFRGILFDYDGTLVQSMRDNFTAWKRALQRYGIEIGEEDYFPFEGISIEALVEKFRTKRTGSSFSADELIRTKEAIFREIHTFSIYPGAGEILDFLEQNRIPRGIVTSALMERLTRTTPKGFLDRFDTVISGEASGRGKPYPDPYLAGARSLGLPPQDCVVIENAPLGVQSAKSAGCYCVAVCSTNNGSHFPNADHVVSSMEELSSSGLLRKLVGTP